jgi:hypothetical protein
MTSRKHLYVYLINICNMQSTLSRQLLSTSVECARTFHACMKAPSHHLQGTFVDAVHLQHCYVLGTCGAAVLLPPRN